LRDYADQLDDKGRHKVERISFLASRMNDLLDALLAYSRLERAEMERTRCDMMKIVQEAVEENAQILDETGATVDIDTPLPETVCTPDRVRDVFSQLIENAAIYNDQDEKRITVGHVQGSDGKPGRFYVRDNGIGIAPSDLESVFTIFRRLHGPEDYGAGIGAGLTLSRLAIERHGGELWAESEPGQGTTFSFTLPDNAHD
jgi:light-regulated signal transduction histidine kinase (bacteriophytochrome)